MIRSNQSYRQQAEELLKRALEDTPNEVPIVYECLAEASAGQEAPAEPATQAPAEPVEADESKDPEPIFGLSNEQTRFFYRVREGLARNKAELNLSPDGELFTQKGNGQKYSYGSIHDGDCVAKLLDMHIHGPGTEELIRAMLNVFPENTRLKELFEKEAWLQAIHRRREERARIEREAAAAQPQTADAVRPLPRRVSEFDIHRAVPARPERRIGTEFITGSAGTGKTYEVQQRKAADPDGVILAATTGIAAVNLGPEVTTINSALRFFNHNSLVDAYNNGALQDNIRGLVEGGMRELVIDEISMLCAPALDLLYRACNEVTQEGDHPRIKLTLAGDFCQLPPIADSEAPGTERYAFEADCWQSSFAQHITRLRRIRRQENEDFVRALQAARRGDGEETLAHLQTCGVRFEPRLIEAFEGTTLIATNDHVDAYNRRRLLRLPDGDRVLTGESTRWGHHPSESSHIPDRFYFKIGAYVMILANDCPAFRWVNGDCGTVVGTHGDHVVVRLQRNNAEVRIGKIIRERKTRTRPRDVLHADITVVRDRGEYNDLVQANGGEPPRQVVMLREPRPEWITGWVNYYPLRLAYATTVHKSQGLSLNSLQLDLSSGFLANPAMMYVALSRCRTPGGLVLVGTPEQLVAKTRIDPRVTEWL